MMGIMRLVFIFGSAWFFLFIQPIPHSAALRNLDAIWLLIAVTILVVQQKITINWRSPQTLGLISLLILMLISTLLSSDPVFSLSVLRKDCFVPLLALVVLLAGPDMQFCWRLVMTATVAALGVRTLLILPEWSMIAMPARLEAQWVKGYAIDAALFVPMTLATLMVGTRHRWIWIAISGLFCVEAMIVIAYESRTALLVLVLATIIAAYLSGRRYVFPAVVFAIIVGGVVSVVSKPDLKEKYAMVFNVDSYKGTQGMSARYPIWHGVAQLVKVQPWLGYGPGWKKMSKIAREGGYLERWRSGSEIDKATAWYFDHDGGTVNPHNLPLQILFETGALGLIAFLAFWTAFSFQVLTVAVKKEKDKMLTWFSIAGTTFLFSYVLINITNGLWPLPGPVIGLLALAEFSRRQLRLKNSL